MSLKWNWGVGEGKKTQPETKKALCERVSFRVESKPGIKNCHQLVAGRSETAGDLS